MSPGPIEEAGKVAGGVVASLGTQPAVLALIVANIAMLVFIFYALSVGANFRDQMLKAQFEYQHKVSDLLARCVVPRTEQQVIPDPNSLPG